MAPLGVRVELDQENTEHEGRKKRSTRVVIVISSALLATLFSVPISSWVAGNATDSRVESTVKRHEATLRALTGKIAALEERTVKGSIPLLPNRTNGEKQHAVP